MDPISAETACELLEFYSGDARKWTTGEYQDSQAGVYCYCAVGALCEISGRGFSCPEDEISGHDEIIAFNDSFKSFSEFEAALKRIAGAK